MKYIITLLLVIPCCANAQIPLTDFLNLVQNMIANQTQLEVKDELMGIYKKTTVYNSDITSLKVDAQNNAISNWIARTTQSKTDIQNKRALQQSTPGIDVCSSLAPANMEKTCSNVNFIKGLYSTNRSYVSNESPRSPPNAIKIKDRYDQIIDRAKYKRPNLFKESSEVSEDIAGKNDDSGALISIEPVIIMSDKSELLTITSLASYSMIDYIDLIAPPYIYTDEMIVNSKAHPSYKISYMTEQAFKEVPRVSLQKILSERIETDQVLSKLSMLDEFADSQFGADGSGNSVAVKIANSQLAVPDVVWRNIAIMKSFELHMAIEKFKASLNSEFIYTTKFARKVNGQL